MDQRSASSRWAAGLTKWRWPAAAVVAVFFAITTSTGTPDLDLFSAAGQDILAGRWSHVYAADWNQSGPLQLLACRLLALGSAGAPWVGLRVLLDLVLLAAVRELTIRYRCSEVASTAVAAVTTLWLGPWGFWSGHPVEVLIPLLWWRAGVAARGSRPVMSGCLIGATVTIAPWGLLGAPTVLAGRFSTAVRSAFVAAAVAALAYSPFAMTGHFMIFHHVWPVSPYSLVHVLDPGAASFTWPLRLVQAAVIVAAGTAASLALKGRPEGPAIAALATVQMRLLTDPVTYDYYWLPVGTAAIVAAVLIATNRRRSLIAAALAYLPWLAMTLSQAVPRAPLTTGIVMVLLLIGYCVAVRRRPPNREWSVAARVAPYSVPLGR